MRGRTVNRIWAVILSVLLTLCLAGCSSDVVEKTDKQSAAEGIYRIYYTNLDKTELVRHEYIRKSEDFEGILNEILEAFKKADSSDVRSALPEQVEIQQVTVGINEIDVDFNAEYLSLDPITELLLRGALVKTLLQMQGVDTVRFTVDSQSLVIGGEEDGTSIVSENRTGYYSSNLNTARLVIEEMLKGPDQEGLLPVAVDGTLVQDVSVNNGYCIVDFSEEINNAPPWEVIASPETVLYAFTDAIIDSCTDDRITGVRFRINGASDVRFRDQVNLDQVFQKNADLIYAPVVKLEESEGQKAQE